jgi:integrase
MLKAILKRRSTPSWLTRIRHAIDNPETGARVKPVLPKWQARQILETLPFRDRLIAMIAAFCAMRPGEIFGLRWSSWRKHRIPLPRRAVQDCLSIRRETC